MTEHAVATDAPIRFDAKIGDTAGGGVMRIVAGSTGATKLDRDALRRVARAFFPAAVVHDPAPTPTLDDPSITGWGF